MTGWLTGAMVVAAGVLAVPVCTFFGECALGAGWKPRTREQRPPNTRTIVMIPAHNEEQGIRHTLEQLKQQLEPNDSILVVADNCTDSTAAVARDCGAEVIERTHATERGKGYALSFGTDHIAKMANSPEVVIVLDADCVFTPGSVCAVVAECVGRGSPVQADDELVVPPGRELDIKTRVSMFAFRVKNSLRPRGLDRLGMPRQLAGTGMAFPWHILRDAPNMRGWITEDLVLGLELALRGACSYLCQDAKVESDVAPSPAGHAGQRQRWEHGHLEAIRKYVPVLLREGLRQRRVELFVLAADLAVPPLALLTTVALGGVTVALVGVPLGGGWLPVTLMATEVGMIAAGVAVAWRRVGVDLVGGSDVAGLPGYVLGKLPSYSRWASGRGDKSWVRAERRNPR